MEYQKVSLDTDVLIDNSRNNERTVNYLSALEKEKIVFSTTTVNVSELYYGAYRSSKPLKGLSTVSRILSRLFTLDFDQEASEVAGRILAELETQGKAIEFRVVLIGATALVNGYTILTKNLNHFTKIPDLKVIKAP